MQWSSTTQGLKCARVCCFKKNPERPPAGQRKFTPCIWAEVSLLLASLGFSVEADLSSTCYWRSCRPPVRFGSGTDFSKDLSDRRDSWDRGGKEEEETSSFVAEQIWDIFWPLILHRLGNRKICSKVSQQEKPQQNEPNDREECRLLQKCRIFK